MTIPIKYAFLVCLLLAFSSVNASAIVITSDLTWDGERIVEDDVYIPKGVTLTIPAGSLLKIHPSENTRIDPEFISHQTEFLVRGSLIVQGEKNNPVRFKFDGDSSEERWAGIIVDGGTVRMEYAELIHAEAGIHVLEGKAQVISTTLSKNRYGIISQGRRSTVELNNSLVTENEYGVLSLNGGELNTTASQFLDNEKLNEFSDKAQYVRITPIVYDLPLRTLTHTYTNETLTGTTIWRGKVLVNGQVRIPLDGRLVIMPGTVVEFSYKDSNDDGIGENGILIQGGFIAKGTQEKPIFFRSAEQKPKAGDWDSINILGSDRTKNLIEFAQVEHGYRGMHFHYANVSVTNSVMRNNYRGIQFQESLVEIRNNHFYKNKSAIQARDSEVVFKNNRIYANINGANFFRMSLSARDNVFANNQLDGLRIREGAATVENNVMSGNRYGFLIADTLFGKFNKNLMSGNLEFGLALRNTDSIETRYNAIVNNGLQGLIVRDSRGEVIGNMISGNGERGVGILSFNGEFRKNLIFNNGLYGIGLDGSDTVDAAHNWWGSSDLDKEIFDKKDDPALGTVIFEPVLKKAIDFEWPVGLIPTDISWSGNLHVKNQLTVLPGATLSILPGTTVRFDSSVGMDVFGTVHGKGTQEKRITFTSLVGEGASSWSEISLDRAMGSYFENCDFSNASWGVHSHYTNLVVDKCRFFNNDGGMRFRSGPLEIKNSIFKGNRIGLRAYLATAHIHDNVVTGNEMGIYVRQQGSGLTINRNNIFNNERYNMRLGDFNDEDVNAVGNWWGGADVIETVFDGTRESYIGKVIFEPVLEQPIELDWMVQ